MRIALFCASVAALWAFNAQAAPAAKAPQRSIQLVSKHVLTPTGLDLAYKRYQAASDACAKTAPKTFALYLACLNAQLGKYQLRAVVQ